MELLKALKAPDSFTVDLYLKFEAAATAANQGAKKLYYGEIKHPESTLITYTNSYTSPLEAICEAYDMILMFITNQKPNG